MAISKRYATMMLAVVFLSTGCAVSSTDKVIAPKAQKSGFMGLSKTADIKVTSPKALKKQTGKVIIGSFKMGFVTDTKARAVAKGGVFSSATGQGKASALTHLVGLTQEQMQKIATDTYANLVQELQNNGYTVLTPAELADQSAYTALQTTGEASYEEGVPVNLLAGGKVNYVAPDGMKVVYFIGEKKAAFSLSTQTIKHVQELSEATGANVLTVNYIVNFVGADTHGGFTSTASVKVGQSLRVIAGSAMTFYNGKKDMPSVITLGQPVYSEAEFATIDNITSKAGKALGTAVNVATALLGGGTSQSEEYNFNIDTEKYHAAVTDIANRSNQKMVAKLVENRPAQ